MGHDINHQEYQVNNWTVSYNSVVGSKLKIGENYNRVKLPLGGGVSFLSSI